MHPERVSHRLLLFPAALLILMALVSCSFRLTVTTKGDGTVSVTPQTDQYQSGTVVTLTPVPSGGGGFVHWANDLTGSDNPAVVTMDSSKEIEAVFLPVTLASGQVTITAHPSSTLPIGQMAYFTIDLDLPAGQQYRAWIYYDSATFTGESTSYYYTASAPLEHDATGVVRGAVPAVLDADYNFVSYAGGSVTEWTLVLNTWDGATNSEYLTENFYHEVTWE